MISGTLPAGADVELSYIDSSAPRKPDYITIIAVHGMVFTNVIFEKLVTTAPSNDVRVIALNRRSFPGSTPFSPEEMNLVLNDGSSTEKDAFMKARGCELGIFINNLIQKHDLPPISGDGKTGGIILLGWSLGTFLTLAMISNAQHLPDDVQRRLTSSIRSLVIDEPAAVVLGLPIPKQNWTPLLDTSLPPGPRLLLTAHWLTSYFDHDNLTKRDTNSLAWWTPSTDRIPTVFNFPTDRINGIMDTGPGALSDTPFLVNFGILGNQLNASYRKALYDSESLKEYPHLKVTVVAGDRSVAFGIQAMWAIEDDKKEAGYARRIEFKVIKGANHLWHWDSPQECLDILLENA